MSQVLRFTAKAEVDGVGTEGEEAVLGTDFVAVVPTISNTVDPAYLELHGYAKDDELTEKAEDDGLGDLDEAIEDVPNFTASQPPPAPATEVTPEYLVIHRYIDVVDEEEEGEPFFFVSATNPIEGNGLLDTDNVRPQWTFNRSVNAATVNALTVLMYDVTAAAALVATQVGQSTFAGFWVPTTPFIVGHTVRLTITTGVHDSDGNPLDDDFVREWFVYLD